MEFTPANRRILYSAFGISVTVSAMFCTYVILRYVVGDRFKNIAPESSVTKILLRHHKNAEGLSSDHEAAGTPLSHGMRVAAGGGGGGGAVGQRLPMLHERLSLSEPEDGRKRSSSFPRYLYNPATATGAPPLQYVTPPHGAHRYHAPTHDLHARAPPLPLHGHAVVPSPPVALLPLPEMIRHDSEFTPL